MAGVDPTDGERLLASGNFSDFKITCRGQESKVHRNIVAAVSPFLKSACESGFKESETRVIDLPDQDPIAVARTLTYIYTGNYTCTKPTIPIASSDELSEQNSPRSDLRNRYKQVLMAEGEPLEHANVYTCAEMLGIEKLKDLALEKLTHVWMTPPMRSSLFSWFERPEFPMVLKTILGGTPASDAGLRQYILRQCVENHTAVEKQEEVVMVLREHEPTVFMLAVSIWRDAELQISESATSKRKALSAKTREIAGWRDEVQSKQQEIDTLRDQLKHKDETILVMKADHSDQLTEKDQLIAQKIESLSRMQDRLTRTLSTRSASIVVKDPRCGKCKNTSKGVWGVADPPGTVGWNCKDCGGWNEILSMP